jgi:hypothetical protein
MRIVKGMVSDIVRFVRRCLDGVEMQWTICMILLLLVVCIVDYEETTTDAFQLEHQAQCSLHASHIPQQHLQSFSSKQEDLMPTLQTKAVLIAIMQHSRMDHL